MSKLKNLKFINTVYKLLCTNKKSTCKGKTPKTYNLIGKKS